MHTHGVCGESSEHDSAEAFIKRRNALLPDQLPQNISETVWILSLWS